MPKNRTGNEDVSFKSQEDELEAREEARRTWERRKQIGLEAINEDDVIDALMKGREDGDNAPKQRRMRRSRKKRSDPCCLGSRGHIVVALSNPAPSVQR